MRLTKMSIVLAVSVFSTLAVVGARTHTAVYVSASQVSPTVLAGNTSVGCS
jgi:hypothetical protein